MLLIHFAAHDMSAQQRQALENLVGQSIDDVRSVSVPEALLPSIEGQIAHLVDEVGCTVQEWQALAILVILPQASFIAACILAELHGRMGHFPSVVDFAEHPVVVHLQAIRSASLHRRF